MANTMRDRRDAEGRRFVALEFGDAKQQRIITNGEDCYVSLPPQPGASIEIPLENYEFFIVNGGDCTQGEKVRVQSRNLLANREVSIAKGLVAHFQWSKDEKAWIGDLTPASN